MSAATQNGQASASVELGKRLRDRRVELGLRQEDVGAPLVSHVYISLIESGKRWPSARVFDHLIAVLNLPRDSLGDLVDLPREADELHRARWLVDELERLLGPRAPLEAVRTRIRIRDAKVAAAMEGKKAGA